MSLVKQIEDIKNKWSDLSFKTMWGITREEWIKKQIEQVKEN